MSRNKLLSWVLVAIVIGAWAVSLRPTFLGGPTTYVMVSGISMEPSMHTGDLVIATRRDGYNRGDVVAFRVPQREPGGGAIVIHRVMGGNGEDGYITKGDNRESADLWHPLDADIKGAMLFVVPKAGTVVSFLRSPIGIALAAGVMVFLMFVLDGRSDGTKPSDPPVAAGGLKL
jgi:signal peptidase I